MTTTDEAPTALRSNRAVRDFRSWLTFDVNPSAYDTLLRDLADWLRERKHWDDDLSDGRRSNEDRDLFVLRHEDATGRTFRARLIEASPVGEWRTEFTVRSATDNSGWLALDVTNGNGRRVAVPGLIRSAMTSVELLDGPAQLAATPTVYRPEDLDLFYDVLCDPDRQGLVFVAATDRYGDVDSFKRDVQQWTAQTQGLAQVVLLDPLATEQFTADVVPSQAPVPWTIRTYYPEVDPADPVDARRHKILGRARLSTSSIDDVRYLLGSLARARASERQLPSSVTRVMRALARQEDRLRMSRILEASAAPSITSMAVAERSATPEVSQHVQDAASSIPVDVGALNQAQAARDALLADLARLKKLLGLPDLADSSVAALVADAAQTVSIRQDASSLAQELDERREALDALSDRLADMRERYEDAELAAVEAQQGMQKAADESRYLRGLLRDSGQYDDAVAVVPREAAIEYPEDFDSLLERIAEFDSAGVTFSGDRRPVLSLAPLDPVGRIAGQTWSVLLVIADFVAAKTSGLCTSMFDYLSNPPAGARPFPLSKFAPAESETTMTMFGDQRIFPVPVEVFSTGLVTMEAHFKLAKAGMKSPRLYLYDDVHSSGRVYVGYIGPHLRTPSTN